ncbi:ribosome biogenesis/translation initiation ATPase RLI [Candidatus Micrarchaeota archaeon]|nr:ribosome biogenesis/translation initiation ATPase RLI [Candidatus Micrarchaeota archaeon]
MRIAVLDRNRCVKEKCGYQCQKFCPGVLMGEETIVIDEKGYPVISEILCTGCGICVKKCPVNAITIVNLPTEGENPIFQYGINAFRLYGMPLPAEGVTGFVGKNGIGKSTAMKLLTGLLKPNFGKYDKSWEWNEILENMNNIQRAYFKTIAGEDVQISYKPQHVDLIPQSFKGTVNELLEKVNPKRVEVSKIVEWFELKYIYERHLDKLSGGEMQRVAIAAAYLKQGDFYFFDEPASYLDVEQRLKIAKKIKELSLEKKVVVVEHDMALFDYLADFVYVFFGTENAYGAVSKVKSVRNGINEYLAGYLQDENVKFRDHEISFKQKAEETGKAEIMMTYPRFEKKFESFVFESEEGEINKGEVIGILGPNAIGKSLFVKILAGVEKPDNEKWENSMKVSYKSQYVKADENITVGEIFSREKLDQFVFNESVRKLGIGTLMDKQLSDLSGGELQRVAITLALSREADVYLFDEPSAFLDVEQRLEFASLLHSVISNSEKVCFVVDHDLILIELLAKRIMLFSGESSVHGESSHPMKKYKGMNEFLKRMNITMRRDPDSLRPRINKHGSVKDREQKEKGEYYEVY